MTALVSLLWLASVLFCLTCTWYGFQDRGVKDWKTWTVGILTLGSAASLVESVYGV